jgi:hypothetical protein
MSRLLKSVFPYVLAVSLWALPDPRFNPFGILAMIPAFYYMFIARVRGWKWFGFMICFLLDYNAGTLFVFSGMFLIAIAANILFGIFDMEEDGLAVKKFGLFIVPSLLALFIFQATGYPGFWIQLAGALWLCALVMILYLLLSALMRWADDR